MQLWISFWEHCWRGATVHFSLEAAGDRICLNSRLNLGSCSLCPRGSNPHLLSPLPLLNRLKEASRRARFAPCGHLLEDAAGGPRELWGSTRTLTLSQQFLSYWEEDWDLLVVCWWWLPEVSISMTSSMSQERINTWLISLEENRPGLEWVVTAVCSPSLEVQTTEVGRVSSVSFQKAPFPVQESPSSPLSHSPSVWQ